MSSIYCPVGWYVRISSVFIHHQVRYIAIFPLSSSLRYHRIGVCFLGIVNVNQVS